MTIEDPCHLSIQDQLVELLVCRRGRLNAMGVCLTHRNGPCVTG